MNKTAEKGFMWALTAKGYESTPEAVKPERQVGKALQGFIFTVPESWVEKGYVEQIPVPYVLQPSHIGSFLICESGKNFPLSGQAYGYIKKYNAEAVLHDLYTGKETPESLYKLWTAGTNG